MYRKQHIATVSVVMILIVAALAAAETTRKEMHFKVGRRANISIVNQYGPITVKSGVGKRVSVTATSYSGKVEIDQSKRGNRVAIVSHLSPGADADSGRVDYEVVVPMDANLTLHTATGPLHVEKLHGDMLLEGSTANVDVRDVSAGRVHIKTLNGPVTLTNVNDGNVEITSVSGDVSLHQVNGASVHVNSSSGRIHYDGEFGEGGQYSLTSHSGDIEAIAPSYASIEVVARSVQGRVDNDFTLQPEHTAFVTRAGSAFAGTVGQAASSVNLLSFSGKIHLKKREP